jgi:hypothetical protein
MAKTRKQLTDYANTYINTNGSQAITGSILNTMEVDIIEAMAMESEISGFKPRYNFVKVTGVTVASVQPAYQEIARLNLTNVQAGTCEYKLSVAYNYNSTTKSVMFRFSLDSGTTWFEFSTEPKERHDESAFFYAFPKEILTSGTDHAFIMEASKESNDVFVIDFADLMFERVL